MAPNNHHGRFLPNSLTPSPCFISIHAYTQLICFDLSSVYIISLVFKRLGSGHGGQFATVDHADMRGLVTDLTSLRRGAGHALRAGVINETCALLTPI